MGQVRIGPTELWDPSRSAQSPLVMPSPPDRVDITAIDDSVLCHLDMDMLDILLAEEQLVQASTVPQAQMRMELLRNTEVFRKIPLENVEQAVSLLSEVEFKAGDEPVKMGKESDQFYIIVDGSGELWRIDEEEYVPAKAADLGAGDNFGEEGLIMGAPSPVTIKINTDCRALALGRDDFQRLLAKPLVREVNVQVARTMRDEGYPMLDVRMEEEWEEVRIPGAKLLPLSQLRLRSNELDRDKEYLVYCRSGRRSSVGAFLLGEMGFKATSMAGGMNAWTFEKEGPEADA
jgi:rhodanese-related sulfurtransferase